MRKIVSDLYILYLYLIHIPQIVRAVMLGLRLRNPNPSTRRAPSSLTSSFHSLGTLQLCKLLGMHQDTNTLETCFDGMCHLYLTDTDTDTATDADTDTINAAAAAATAAHNIFFSLVFFLFAA